MRIYVAVTDDEWFALHASKQNLDEVIFWRPSPEANFKVLQPGEMLLFKLHSPNNYIVGGGFFARFLQLPVNTAWEAFGEANGVKSMAEMRTRIGKYRRRVIEPHENPTIGCIMLAEPFCWDRALWIPSPADFMLNTVAGKGYDAESGRGRALWEEVATRLAASRKELLVEGTATAAALRSEGYGKPQLVLPRLGQGLFRVIVTDAYNSACAITGEKTLPVLEAAHIKPYAEAQRHEISNGLLLRSDLHKLFDSGYITIDPKDRRLVVSRRIREEFSNGRHYYALEGQALREPTHAWARPKPENLEYHAYSIFR
jgi:putative restriction endonuclease